MNLQIHQIFTVKKKSGQEMVKYRERKQNLIHTYNILYKLIYVHSTEPVITAMRSEQLVRLL